MKITSDEQYDFYYLIQEFLQNEKINEMKKYVQHGSTTTYFHCIAVAYYSYYLALHLPGNFSIRSTVRGAVLHDFYLYDWHIPHKSHRLHGYVHPGFALANAKKYFKLNQVEEDIISKHMWPLTIRKIPRYREALLVCLVDKLISFGEILYLPTLPKKLIPKLEGI